MTSALKVVIIGGVACGPKTASRLKRVMPTAEITLIDKDEILSYGACGLPYYVEGQFKEIAELTHTPAGIARNPAFFEKVKGFQARTRTEALSIDRQSKTVQVKDLDRKESYSLAYDKLVLATGSRAFKPPIPGLDLKNVWFMTHPDHAEEMAVQIQQQQLKKAVLIGAGFIGLEMAEALRRKGLDVTIVEMAPQIMPGVLDADMAAYSAQHLRSQGVQLALGERAVAIEGDGCVTALQTTMQTHPADLVVVAVGTRPNDELAREAGLSCQNGIVVNSYGQTSDPDIYAGGDCVINHYSTADADSMYVPLGSTANKHGRVIADHIAGQPSAFAGITATAIVQAFDFTIGRTGLTETTAAELNLDFETTTWAGADKPHYMDAKSLVIKMIARKKDRRLLGIQVAGLSPTGKGCLDVAASAILFGGRLDQLANIDFAYAPPYSPPIEPLATCAHVLINKLDGIAKGISAFEARKRIENGDVYLLDTRTPDEFKTVRLPYVTVHIPLGALRDRAKELPRDKEILTLCMVSMRGYEAQRILNAAGYEKVCFIEGGLVGWPFTLQTDPPPED